MHSSDAHRRPFAAVAFAFVLNLRIVAPPERVDELLALLEGDDTVINVVHLPGAARKPPGDLVLCDAAREEADDLLSRVRALGVLDAGTIVLESVDTAISPLVDAAKEAARGAPADAVVWEQVTAVTSEEAELSWAFLNLMVVAALIASVGIATDSPILIVGAMVVGPEFGPLAGLSVAMVQRRWSLARRSLRALAVGFPAAIAAAALATVVYRWTGLVPSALPPAARPLTRFISEPDEFTVIVALLAGVAGTLSLTSAKSGALIGVLVSITTIPAAADIGVSAALADWEQCLGAAAQLLLNLSCIVLAATVTLAGQRMVTRPVA